MNQLRTVLLLGVLSLGLVALGGALGGGFAPLFALLAVVMNVVSYFFSDRLVLAMSRARPLSEAEAPEVHSMVAELSARAGIPKPRLFWIDEAQPNAFATGRNPAHGAVAVTAGLMQALSTREVRGVLAHELAHIANRDILVASVAATLSSVITSLAHMAQWAALFGRGDEDGEGEGGGLLFALFAPIAATLVQLGISRTREYGADEKGARLCGDPEALASALERLEAHAQHVPAAAAPATASLYIVNPFAGGQALMRLFSTHPATAERVRRLRLMAAEPPRGWNGMGRVSA